MSDPDPIAEILGQRLSVSRRSMLTAQHREMAANIQHEYEGCLDWTLADTVADLVAYALATSPNERELLHAMYVQNIDAADLRAVLDLARRSRLAWEHDRRWRGADPEAAARWAKTARALAAALMAAAAPCFPNHEPPPDTPTGWEPGAAP